MLRDYQGQGIGTTLLQRLARCFTEQGRRSVCVGIDPANPYRRFYEKHHAGYINEHWLVWDDISAIKPE